MEVSAVMAVTEQAPMLLDSLLDRNGIHKLLYDRDGGI